MIKRNQYAIGAIFLVILAFFCSCSEKVEAKKDGSRDYETLVSLYQEFRESTKDYHAQIVGQFASSRAEPSLRVRSYDDGVVAFFGGDQTNIKASKNTKYQYLK